MGIVVNDSQNLFMLQTRSNSYAFGIDNQGLVRHLYWGSRINAMEDFEMPELAEVSTNDPVYEITKEEFPVYGGLRYKRTLSEGYICRRDERCGLRVRKL